MDRTDVAELHYIYPIANVASICENGISSHNAVREIAHVSLALPEVQSLRETVPLQDGRMLHDYVNLYFHARNPMMYYRREQHGNLCVLRISDSVLDIPAAMIADRNAARRRTWFRPSPEGLRYLNRHLVFARDWTHRNPERADYQKAVKCAEVLVAHHVSNHETVGASGRRRVACFVR
jgi:hypothetical protein